MKRLHLAAASALTLLASLPSQAAVVSLATDVDLSSGPYTVNIGSDASYTFSYSPNGLSTVAVSMTGTGEVYGNGFFSPNSPDPLQIDVLVPDQLSLGQFFQQTGTQSIPYSASLSSIALRFMTGGQTYYGYAQAGGSSLVQFAYNDTPLGSISTGELPASVPEPATWAMLVVGFGLTGGALRRRRLSIVRPA
ncbi:PEP-CTERM sorting domain-containing protein [Sphingomonas sp. AP4-R1]|uniref:PEPxxWA-CTERM sorting domain-containing protein n=1 Tax=Sphingomonas sp. AP4-R1 TaxID=2735134 RepID=UPI0014932F6B|nr:PEPxxWA-CTERM sorting domain-containing protein [Sphingomonas sp. AP4-R1]QJU59329.1 PEP-CTERM sorting domain-containing protein [Sphingomonas sp. AP4-R1]